MGNVAKDFAQLISQSKSNKTGPYDTQATVKRVEGNTVWVSIPGGVDETPIDKTVNCSAGDKVQVRVSGGRAWITGNASAPPTDDKTANEAKGVAVDAKETADAVEGIAVNASATAVTAKTIAEGVNEHFWHDNTGAHVTEVTQEEWNEPTDPNYHSGGNTLITSQGMAIRNGIVNLAEFGASGATIGQTGEAQAKVTQYAFSATDKEGDAFFIAEDLRNEAGGVHTVTDTFISDGVTTNINLTYRATNTTYTVTVDGGTPPPSMVKTQTQIVFGAVPQAGAVIVATYQTASQYAKAYTLGIRADNSAKGGMSVAEGEDCIASGRYSHAEGHGCTSAGTASHAEGISTQALYNACHAEGAYTQTQNHGSHAEGISTQALGFASHSQNYYTKAEHAYQTAIGKYNDNSSNNALEIGNGTADNARSNALTVDWSGNVEAAGSITVNNHSSSIGTTKIARPTTAVSAPRTTYVELCHFTLEPGVWIIVAYVRWANNSNGYRLANVATTSQSTSSNVLIPAVNGNVTSTQFTRIVEPTANTTYYLNAYHNSTTTPLSMPAGAADGTINGMYAIRIA